MQTEKFQKLIFRILLLLCVVSFLLLVYQISEQQTPEELEENATIEAESQAEIVVGNISPPLTDMVTFTTSIAEDLSSDELKDDQVVQRINETLENHAEFYGIAVAYDSPMKHSINGSGLYAPYVRREQCELRLTLIEEDYYYTLEDRGTDTIPRII